MTPARHSHATSSHAPALGRALLLLAFAGAANAHAANEAKASGVVESSTPSGAIVQGASKAEGTWAKAWRGTTVSYGHAVSAISLSRSAEPWYNPTYAHRLELTGAWSPSERWFTRVALAAAQELTVNDDYESPHELVLGDLILEGGARSLQLPLDLSLTTGVRVGLPTSKSSAAQTRLFALGPTASLSRRFELAQGLTLSYAGRFDFRFHRFTTAQSAGPQLVICSRIDSDFCLNNTDTGTRNAWGALAHGPSMSLELGARWSVSTSFQLQNQFLYRLAPEGDPRGATLDARDDPGVRFANAFNVAVSFKAARPLALAAGVTTVSSQLGLDGRYRNPFFNRLTVVSLDTVLDFEALVNTL